VRDAAEGPSERNNAEQRSGGHQRIAQRVASHASRSCLPPNRTRNGKGEPRRPRPSAALAPRAASPWPPRRIRLRPNVDRQRDKLAAQSGPNRARANDFWPYSQVRRTRFRHRRCRAIGTPAHVAHRQGCVSVGDFTSPQLGPDQTSAISIEARRYRRRLGAIVQAVSGSDRCRANALSRDFAEPAPTGQVSTVVPVARESIAGSALASTAGPAPPAAGPAMASTAGPALPAAEFGVSTAGLEASTAALTAV
jgi:hypothetical protein